MNKKSVFFFNVDTSNDFINSDGALYVPEAESLKVTLAKITKFAKDNNILVLNAADYHFADSKELSVRPDFKKTFPPHCMAGTVGAEFISETKPEDSDNQLIAWEQHIDEFDFSKRNFTLLKDEFCVFAGNKNTDKLIHILKNEKDYKIVVVYGVATNVCVKKAVEGLLKHKIDVVVLTDAIKALPLLPNPLPQWAKKLNTKLMSFNSFKDIYQGKEIFNLD